MLGQLLHLNGIDSVIVEDRSRDYVIDRVRAGVLEQGTVDLLHAGGVGSRLQREGLRHDGLYISFQGVRHHIDFADLEITIEKTISEVYKLKQGLEATRNLIAVQHELQVASRIQESILPKIFPPFPERHEIEIYASMTPARQVGGFAAWQVGRCAACERALRALVSKGSSPLSSAPSSVFP